MTIRVKELLLIIVGLGVASHTLLCGQSPLETPDSGGPAPAEILEVGSEEGDAAAAKAELPQGLKSVWDVFLGGDSAEEAPVAVPVDSMADGTTQEVQKKINELSRVAHMNIGKGRVAEAIKNVSDLITLKPYEAEYHFALGLCYRRDGKYAAALKKYQDVLDLGGPRPFIALLRAEAYAAENEPEEAFKHLKEAAIGGRNIITDVQALPLLMRYQEDTDFVKLALQLEKVTVSAARSHDPFTNPFPRQSEHPGDGDVAVGPKTLTPEEQEKLLHDAKRTYERVQFFIKLEDERKAMTAYSSLRGMIKKKDLLTVPKIANDFRILLSRLESLEIEIEGVRLKYYYNQAQIQLAQMKELFTDGEYSRIELLHGEIVKLTQEMEQTNRRYQPVAEQIMAASERWRNRAQVRQDFDSRKPSIQGVIISDNQKLAVLNDRVIEQGETVDDFRVVKVESNRVTFRYRGEEIPLVFRRY
jgi:tetratricopeptide (TPR) repeat protein